MLSVAKNIVSAKQPFKGTVLTLKPVITELQPINTIKGDIDIVGKEERTILVSGIPEGVTKNTVHIHFQREKNNGGEVEDTLLLPEGRNAWVIFEDPKGKNIDIIWRGHTLTLKFCKTIVKYIYLLY